MGKYSENPKYLARSCIKQICRSVTIPTYIQQKYQSTKGKCRKLTFLAKFSERYIQIKSYLCNLRIVNPDIRFIVQIRIFFHCLQVPFFTLIYHSPPPYGRHSWPNYNIAFQIGCERFGYLYYKKYFPIKPKSKDRLSLYSDIYFKMFAFLN